MRVACPWFRCFPELAGWDQYLDDYPRGYASGAGIDVRVVLSDDPEFSSFDIISEDLRDDGPYDGTTLTLSLREGMTLDAVEHLSIWCVPAGASFGDGMFVSL